MKVKHRILDELFQIQLINSKDDIVLEDISLSLDLLKSRINKSEKIFFGALESLQDSKDISIDWKGNRAFITKIGIVNFSDNKYLEEHKKSERERWIFIIKVIGLISTFIAIIIGLFQIFDIIKSKI